MTTNHYKHVYIYRNHDHDDFWVCQNPATVGYPVYPRLNHYLLWTSVEAGPKSRYPNAPNTLWEGVYEAPQTHSKSTFRRDWSVRDIFLNWYVMQFVISSDFSFLLDRTKRAKIGPTLQKTWLKRPLNGFTAWKIAASPIFQVMVLLGE